MKVMPDPFACFLICLKYILKPMKDYLLRDFIDLTNLRIREMSYNWLFDKCRAPRIGEEGDGGKKTRMGSFFPQNGDGIELERDTTLCHISEVMDSKQIRISKIMEKYR